MAQIYLSSLKKLTYWGVICILVLSHILFHIHYPSFFTYIIFIITLVIHRALLCVPPKHFNILLGAAKTWFLSSWHLDRAMWLVLANDMDWFVYVQAWSLKDLPHSCPLASLLWWIWAPYINGIPDAVPEVVLLQSSHIILPPLFPNQIGLGC